MNADFPGYGGKNVHIVMFSSLDAAAGIPAGERPFSMKRWISPIFLNFQGIVFVILESKTADRVKSSPEDAMAPCAGPDIGPCCLLNLFLWLTWQ